MEISTINRIEQYLCDSLIASPLIPLSVNVLRLADAADNEGIVSQTNNIVVRFTNSSAVVKNKVPLIYEETLYFELNFSCQNYLSSSGHDFATQLLTAAKITISGGAPSGAYVQVIEPFHCTSSQFTGLTPESQYTYTQTYSVVIEEVLPYIALDPCVQRGDCNQIFPTRNVVSSLPLGGVVNDEGSVYVPWNPETPEWNPGAERALGVKWSDEITKTGDWVFTCNPDEVFIEDPINQPIYLLSNNSYTEDGKLVVTVWDQESRTPIKNVLYEDTGKKLIRYAVELWRATASPSGQTFNFEDSVLDASFTSRYPIGQFAVVKGLYTKLISDPLNPNSPYRSLTGGTLIGVKTDTFIQTPQGRFFFIEQSPQGKGWVTENSFEVASINSLWKLGCLPCEGGSDPSPLC